MDQMNAENQRIIGRLVQREVLACASYLVEFLGKHTEDKDNEYSEEIQSLLCPPIPDHSDEIETLTEERQKIEDQIDELNTTDEAGEPNVLEEGAVELERLRKAAGIIDSKIDDLKDEQENGDGREFFEHWVVTEWAHRKLVAQGETVEEVFGLHIYARSCTGQALSMDECWWAIANDMEILENQRNDWGKP